MHINADIFVKRVEKVRNLMEEKKLDAIIVTNAANQYYLTGSDIGIATIISKDDVIQVVNALEKDRASEALRIGEVFLISSYPLEIEGLFVGEFHEAIKNLLEKMKLVGKRIGVELDFIRYRTFEKLKSALKNTELIDASSIVTNLRMIKEDFEVELIVKSIKVTEEVLRRAIDYCEEGIKECEVAALIDSEIRKRGCELAFDPIVASGGRSALPHGFSSIKEIKKGEFVVIDLGSKCEKYCSDITRTIVVGTPSKRQKELIERVIEAQNEAIDNISPGVKLSEIDNIARKVLREYGLSRFFIHALGHGIGLSVHEKPTLALNSKDVARKGMVFTVEPGVYIRGYGGVRIEDIVLVTERKAKILTTFEKYLV